MMDLEAKQPYKEWGKDVTECREFLAYLRHACHNYLLYRDEAEDVIDGEMPATAETLLSQLRVVNSQVGQLPVASQVRDSRVARQFWLQSKDRDDDDLGEMAPSAARFHLLLDLRWTLFSASHYLLAGASHDRELREAPVPNFCKFSGIGSKPSGGLVGMKYQVAMQILAELILSAHRRYEDVLVVDKTDFAKRLLSQSPFTCECVRQMWFMMIRVLGDGEGQTDSMSFWQILRSLLFAHDSASDRTVEKTDEGEEDPLVLVYEKITLPSAFIWWLIDALAEVAHVESRPRAKNLDKFDRAGMMIVERWLLKDTLSDRASEETLKCALQVLARLSKKWGPSLPAFSILWEHFHKLLNSHFHRSRGLPVDQLCKLPATPGLWLDKVEALIRLNDSGRYRHGDGDEENNFQLFLRVLVAYSKAPVGSKAVRERFHRNVTGRVKLKMFPRKLCELKELGWYHFFTLVLQMALLEDEEMSTTSTGWLDVVDGAKNEELPPVAFHSVLKGVGALALLSLRRGQDAAPALNSFMCRLAHCVQQRFSRASDQQARALSQKCMALYSTLFDECLQVQPVLGSSLAGVLVHDCLVNSRIAKYLRVCEQAEAKRLLSGLNQLVVRLRSFYASAERRFCPTEEECQEMKKVDATYKALWVNVYPALEQDLLGANGSNIEELAELTAGMAWLTLDVERPFARSFRELFRMLATSLIVRPTVSCYFLLTMVVGHQEKLRFSLGGMDVAIRGWLRCVALVYAPKEAVAKVSLLTEEMLTLAEFDELRDYLPGSVQDAFTWSSGEDGVENGLKRFLLAIKKLLTDLPLHDDSIRSKYCSYLNACVEGLLKSKKLDMDQSQRRHFYGVGSCIIEHAAPVLHGGRNNLLENLISELLILNSVKSMDFKLSAQWQQALGTCLPAVLKGLTSIKSFPNEPLINRMLGQVFLAYLPRFTRSQHPLLCIFGGSSPLPRERRSSLQRLIFTTVRADFVNKVVLARPQERNQLCAVLEFLREACNKSVAFEDKLGSDFIASLGEPLLQLRMKAKGEEFVRSTVSDLIASMLTWKRESGNGDKLVNSIRKLIAEKISFHTKDLFEVLHEVGRPAPSLIRSVMPYLEDKLRLLEEKRGLSQHNQWRRHYRNLDLYIKQRKV